MKAKSSNFLRSRKFSDIEALLGCQHFVWFIMWGYLSPTVAGIPQAVEEDKPAAGTLALNVTGTVEASRRGMLFGGRDNDGGDRGHGRGC
jgi:hypothetical protein